VRSTRQRSSKVAPASGAYSAFGHGGYLFGSPKMCAWQSQLFGGQFAPLWAGDVHDAERLVLEVEGDAGVVAQPGGQGGGCAPKGGLESAALDNVDVAGCQFTVTKVVDAPAAPSAGHAHALLQVRRQFALGSG